MDLLQDEEYDPSILDFSAPFLFSDLELIVEGQSLHAHRAVLSLWSPVFRIMFTKNFKESSSSKIDLKEDKLDEMTEFLKQIYTPGGRNVDSDIAGLLLPVVHRYQVSLLLEAVERRLICNVADDNVFRYLNIADHYSLERLQENCLVRCSKIDLSRLDMELRKQNLPQDMQAAIFRERVNFLELCILNIQSSFEKSDAKYESKMELRPVNYCHDHSRPLSQTDNGDTCKSCVESLCIHVTNLCKQALSKPQVAMLKN